MLYSRRRSLVALLSAAGAYGVSARRTVAFHYQAVFSPGAVRWYTRFSMLVTGGILSAKQTQLLKGDGNKLIAYNWSSAFYPDDDASAPAEWRKLVQQHTGAWLLNAVPMGGGAAAPDRTAFWYDFGDSDLIAARARYMADALANTGYDGYFFDTLGFGHLPARLQEEFRRRHPYLVYDERQGEFLRELRVYLGPRRMIFTNQGYRNPGAFLPNADLDLSS